VWGDDALPDLVEAGEQVQNLLFSPGWLAVQKIVDCEIATIDGELDYGRPKEQAEYAYQHGRRSALRAVEDAARAILHESKVRLARAESAAEPALGG